jgi:hypothetical protein
MRGFVMLGFTAFNFIPLGAPTSKQIAQIVNEVIPRLRAISDR